MEEPAMKRGARVGFVALGVTLGLVVALGGCAKGHTTSGGSSSSSSGTSLPTINVSVQKFKYSGFPDTVKANQDFIVNFSNKEAYPMTHEMVMVAVPSGKTQDDIIADAKKLKDKSEDNYLHFGEIGEVDTGSTHVGVFDLPPGTYVIACWQSGTAPPNAKPEGGPNHLTVGMIHTLTVS
jgi:hypothetical protein